MYDFDWDGETIVLGDEEGQSLTLPEEPTHNQQGLSAPGSLDAFTDFSNFGVFNGNFRKGPPDPSANLDVASSTSGSNFMPGWRFVQSSNTNVTAKQVQDTSSPSGSNLRFTFASGAAGDEAYVEQIIDVGGSRHNGIGHLARFTPRAGAANTSSNLEAVIWLQYLTTDGSVAGMPPEQSVAVSPPVGFGVANGVPAWASTDLPVAGTARYLRVRIGVRRASAPTTATGTFDIPDFRLDAARQYHIFTDDPPATYGPHYLYQGDHDLWWRNHDASVRRILTAQLVPITFVGVNIAAGVNTPLEISDNAMGAAFPRLPMPWAGSVVGLSYRFSTAITAGAIDVEATVGGSMVYEIAGITSGSSGSASQAIGTDTFAAGDAIGASVTTGGGFTPAGSMEISVTVWLALSYDGA